MATIELSTQPQRIKLDATTHVTRMAQTALRDYLDTHTADLASDEYIDLRRAARDAEDAQDAAYLAWKTAERQAIVEWQRTLPGDTVITYNGGRGVLTRVGSVAGFLTLSTGREVRVEVENVWKIERA